MYDCSKGTACLRRMGGQVFPCELKEAARFDRVLTNSRAAVEYFESHGLSHVESIARLAHIYDACEISASTSSKVSFRGRTYALHGPFLGLRPGGEVAVRHPTQNIAEFTRAIDAAQNDAAVKTIQARAMGRLIEESSELNPVGNTVGVSHVYRLAAGAFAPGCHPGRLALYYEYDVAKKAGFLKFYKLPVDLLVGQRGFEEVDRLVGMREFQAFKADGEGNHCITVETIDQRGKFGLPSQPRVPQVELWKPGKGLRLTIR